MTRTHAIAHRGDPYRHRENTLQSLCSAIAAGADAVEVDVRITRDGVPVVHHDASLARLWTHDLPLAALTAREVGELTGGRVPTLRDALAAAGSAPTVRTLIDLPDVAAAYSAVAEVRECDAADRVYYCGGPAAMRAVRAADPAAEIALSWQRAAPPRPSLLADVRPAWLNYRFGLLTPELVRRLHADGYRVGSWTTDTPRMIRRLVTMGADAITSNRIGVLRRILDAAAQPGAAADDGDRTGRGSAGRSDRPCRPGPPPPRGRASGRAGGERRPAVLADPPHGQHG